MLGEGPFDVNFLRQLLRHNGRSRVWVEELSGEGNYHAKVLARIDSEAAQRHLRWIGLIRDADHEPGGKLVRMQNALRRAQHLRFAVPETGWQRMASTDSERSSSLIVMPDGNAPGDIETYLRHVLAHSQAATCVDSFVACVRSEGLALQREAKTWVYGFLAMFDRPGQTLSAAARAGDLPVDLPAYAPLLHLIPHDDETL